MNPNESSYYIVIPGFVRNSSVSADAKLLYGEIASKCNTMGFCWAKNKYFADIMRCNIRSIQRYMSELEKVDFIKIDITKDQDGTLRHIFLTTILSPMGVTNNTNPRDNKSDLPCDNAVTHNKLIYTKTNGITLTPFNSYELKGLHFPKLSPKKEKAKSIKANTKPQVAGAKKKLTMYQRFIEIYHAWYLKNEGMPPKIDGAAGNAAKSLLGYFEKIVKSRAEVDKKEYTPEQFENRVLDAWQLVLDNWGLLEPFYQGKIRIIDINSNIQNIIKQVKNGKPTNGRPVTGGQVSDANLANAITKHYSNAGEHSERPG